MASVGHSQGAGTLTMFSILSGSGLVPAAVNFNPKNVISSCINSHFSLSLSSLVLLAVLDSSLVLHRVIFGFYHE